MPRPINILFVNHTGVVSGAERVLFLILDNLDRRRFQPTVSCPPNSDLARMVAERGVPVVDLPDLHARFTWNPVLLLQYLRSYVRAIRGFRNSPALQEADLIHANSVRAGLLVSFATVGFSIPTIWHLHDMMRVHPISTAIRMAVLFLPKLSVLAVSRAAAEQFRGLLLGVFPKFLPIEVIYNPVDAARFHPNQEDRDRTRTSLQLAPDQFTFAMIGQITPRKGQLEAVEAFANAVKTIPTAKFLIVGAPMFAHDHVYLESLKRTIARLGLQNSVELLGHRSDVKDLLGAADCIVINSRHEPFGLIALEALAASKPVIATRVDGIPELMRNGATGILVPFGNCAALAAAMVRVGQTPELCRRLGENGRIHVEQDFTVAKFIGEFESLYTTTVRPAPRTQVSVA